jgi:hypothetical protein
VACGIAPLVVFCTEGLHPHGHPHRLFRWKRLKIRGIHTSQDYDAPPRRRSSSLSVSYYSPLLFSLLVAQTLFWRQNANGRLSRLFSVSCLCLVESRVPPPWASLWGAGSKAELQSSLSFVAVYRFCRPKLASFSTYLPFDHEEARTQ